MNGQTLFLLGVPLLLSFSFGTAAHAQDALVIDDVNRVGIGESAPSASLEVLATPTTIGTGNSVVLLRRSGGLAFQLDDTTVPGFWNFSVAAGESQFRVSRSGTGKVELTVTDMGDLVIPGTITTSGSCSTGCDRVFHGDYKLETIDQHAEQMWSNSYLPAVGPTLENQPFNLTEKTGGILNELEKAHIYIEQLHKRLESKQHLVEDMLARIEKLEATVAGSTTRVVP